MLLAVAKVVLFNLAIDGPREQMKDGAPSHVIPNGGVTALDEFLSKRSGTLSISCSGKSSELSQCEITRMDRHDIEKAGLRLGVAEFPDALDMVSRHLHRDKISAVSSRSSKTSSRQAPSCACAWREKPLQPF